MVKSKTIVALWKLDEDGGKTHYKSVTVPFSGLSVWKALKNGIFALFGLDLEALRSRRLRRGGK